MNVTNASRLIWSRELWMLYLFAFVYGMASGGMGSCIAALIADTFGLRNIGAIFGVFDLGWGIGAAIGPAIGGIVFDFTESYSVAFLAGALAALVIVLFIALVRRESPSPFVFLRET